MPDRPNELRVGLPRDPDSPHLNVLPLAFAAILFATAVPDELRAPATWSVSFVPRDFLVNVLLYLPLGLGWRHRPAVAAVIVGAMLSGAIELIQLWHFGRQGALFDVLANALGAAWGVLAGRWFARTGHGCLASFAIGGRAAAVAAVGTLLLVLAWSWPARPSTLANWDSSFDMLLGNERTLDRPWRGTIASMALVPEAIDAAQARGWSALAADELRAVLLRRGAYVLPTPVVLHGVSATPVPPEVARSFFDLAVKRNAFAVIATIIPADVQQGGPARVITFSRDQFNRNFDLGQEGARLVFRVRTPTTGSNGMDPHTETPPILEPGRPMTVVATFDGAVARLHVDGQALGRRDLAAAGCAVPFLCGSDLRFAAALHGALLAIIVLAMGKPRSRLHSVLLALLAGLADAALVRLLAVDRGALMHGWGASLLSCLGAACVGLSVAAPARRQS